MMTYSNEEPLEPTEVSEIELNQVAMQIILHSGSAKTLADEAFQLAKEKKFKEAYAKMEQAETEGLLKAHQAQTLVIQEEARGLAHAPSLLFTHAQDHLMTTMCEVSQIKRLIELYELIVGPQ